MKHGKRRVWCVIAAVLAGINLVSLAGCGGGDTSVTLSPTTQTSATGVTGRAVLTVRWPDRSRLIPFAADSIVVRVTRSGALLGEQVMRRPANGGETTALFNRIAPGEAFVSASAFPSENGTGVAQARAEVGIAVVADQTVPVRLTLIPTIDRIEVTPANPTPLAIGATTQVAATAKNAAGEVVVTNTGTIQWRAANPAVATVQPGGLVTAVAPGSSAIEAVETESGKVGTATITVSPASTNTIKCDPNTGHCYERVAVPQNQVLFATIRAAAEARTFGGLTGHLATLTSQAELDFVANQFDLVGCTIGAYRDVSAPGGWRWITGEPWSFTAWNSGEPNNVGGGEDYVNFYNANRLNDVYNTAWGAYLVEYETGNGNNGGGTGDLLVYEGFDYPSGNRLEGKAGGTGWSNAWNEYGQGYTPSLIHTEGLSFGRLRTSGLAAVTTSLRPIGHVRVASTPLGQEGTMMYSSILVRPLAVEGGSPDSYFGFGFSGVGGGKPGRSAFFGIEKPGVPVVATTVKPQPNETYLLVVRGTFRPGNDLIELWVNPTPGQPLPAPGATMEAELSPNAEVGIGCSLRVIYDEYRVGRTWESVSPVTP